MVPPVGLEPTLLSEPDFESGASTNSTTGACGKGFIVGSRASRYVVSENSHPPLAFHRGVTHMPGMTEPLPDLAVVYEHPEWFEPLFAALDRHGVSYVKVPLAGDVFDPEGSPAPATVVFSRVAMSSFLREPEHPIFYAQSLFEHWQGQGTRVVNASALNIDTSKARQMSLIARLGLPISAKAIWCC